ncbi:hypothetical protein ACM6Q7_28245 [Peribacillus butanolivorans]|uniref:hypothetical protein n=1 Tax=Peribacillus butanolivorans TaxID=421767 RepID=UPI0039FD356F
MDTKILYYKKFKGSVKSIEYVNWAMHMLANDFSTQSLSILSSFNEPLNIFEVEDYFSRAIRELSLQQPLHEECAKYYIYELLRKILNDEDDVLEIAYEIYNVIREHFTNEELSVWYDISEKIDDFRYGDNIANITKGNLITTIVNEAKKQLKSNFNLN